MGGLVVAVADLAEPSKVAERLPSVRVEVALLTVTLTVPVIVL
jgi:hypothetical protein